MEGQVLPEANGCWWGGGGVYRLCGPIILKGSLFVSVQLGPIFKIYYAGGFAGGGGGDMGFFQFRFLNIH